jgi:pimeloyl-ACP methyl ester carboxylesterase
MPLCEGVAMDGHDRHDIIGGRRVHWREWGDPEAEPLVLLHGAWLAAAFYDTFAERLAARRHVLAVDQRGHGETDHAEDYSWPLWLDDIAAFADHVGHGQFDLVGHSGGAYNAGRFAGRYPDRVNRLALLEGGYGPFTSPQQGEYWTTAFRLNPEEGFESLDAYVNLVCELFPRSGRADVWAGANHFEQRPDGRWHWPHPADVNILTQVDPDADEERDLQRAITAPTLVVQAEASELFVGDAYAALADSLVDGRAVLLPDAGHNLQWENVAGSTELILGFLNL